MMFQPTPILDTGRLLLDLPNELLEHILEILQEEKDTLSLRACALTCQFLSVWSQSLLFRQVKLKAQFQQNVISPHYLLPIPESFIFLLRRSPHLAKCVRTFKLELRTTPARSAPTTVVHNSAADEQDRRPNSVAHSATQVIESQIPSEEDVPLVRNLFIGLEEFRLTAINDPYCACPWYQSNCGLIKTLGQALAITTSLKVLDVTGVPDFPLSILKGCTTLRSLWVSRVVEEEDYTEEEITELWNTHAALKSENHHISQNEASRCAPSFLHLGRSSSIYTLELIKNTHGAVNLDKLTELSIECSEDPSNTRGLTGSDWPQVTSLHLHAPGCRLLVVQVSLLASFKALQSITLHTPVPHAIYLEQLLTRVVGLLQGATLSRETLNKVVVELVFNNLAGSMDLVSLSTTNWDVLENLRGHFQKLQNVTIYLRNVRTVGLWQNDNLRRLLEDNSWISIYN